MPLPHGDVRLGDELNAWSSALYVATHVHRRRAAELLVPGLKQRPEGAEGLGARRRALGKWLRIVRLGRKKTCRGSGLAIQADFDLHLSHWLKI